VCGVSPYFRDFRDVERVWNLKLGLVGGVYEVGFSL